MKPETELRNLRAEAKRLRHANYRLQNTVQILNMHADRQAVEIKDWTQRFDNLLKVLPPKP